MEKLQKKGVFISSNYVKKDNKEYYIISVLLDNTENIIKIFTDKATYDSFKGKSRFSPILVNIDININTNKIYYSL